MVWISREHLLHLIVHGVVSLAIGMHDNGVFLQELSPPTGAMILCILLPALFLELLLARVLEQGPLANQMTARLYIGHFCLSSALFLWSGNRTNTPMPKRFHAVKSLRPVVTYVALHVSHAENLICLGLMSTILYSYGLHLLTHETTSPEVQEGASIQLFIGGVAAEALGLAVIQRLFQRDNFFLQRLVDSLFYIAPISLALMYVFGRLSESCILFPVSANMFSMCLFNFVAIIAVIYSTWTMIKSFGAITLLFVDDVVDEIIAVASKDHPQSTITMTSLLGYLIASWGFIMYRWAKDRTNIDENGAAHGELPLPR